MTSLYSIDRQNAARILDVSVRTIDRYIASGKIRRIKNQGRTWLSNEDIKDMVSDKEQTMSGKVASQFFSESQDDTQKTKNVVPDEEVEIYDNYEKTQSENRHNQNYTNQNSEKTSEYKKLYEDAKEELEEKNKKLQQATYRIGQLETQIKTMVPQIEYEKQQKFLVQKAENMQSLFNAEVKKREVATKRLLGEIKLKENELESEKFNKAIYAVLLFLITFTLILVIFLNYLS